MIAELPNGMVARLFIYIEREKRMPKQYKEVFRGKTARTLELLREEQEPKTPLEILIEEEENEFDVAQKKQEHLRKEVRRALSNLSLRQRQCIKLSFMKQKTQQQIANELKISRNTVKWYIEQARKNLKKSLKETHQNAEKTLYYEG